MFKNKVKRIIVPLVALVVTLAMTITSTYAWFTMSAAPELQGMELEVTSGTYTLLISIDQDDDPDGDYTFDRHISATQINTLLATIASTPLGEAGKTTAQPLALGAFTSEDGKSITDEGINGTNKNATNPNENYGEKGVEGGWLQFKLRFRSIEALDVVLSVESKITTPDTIPLTLKPAYAWDDLDSTDYGSMDEITKGTGIFTSAAYAARFSFLEYDDATSVIGDVKSVWSPAETESIIDMRLTSTDDLFADHPVNTEGDGYVYEVFKTGSVNNFANDYRGDLLGASFYDDSDSAVENDMKLNDYALADLNDPTILLTLTSISVNGQTFYQGTLIINVWLEGWDPNCANTILNDMFFTTLVFNGIPVVVGP